jgi:hypothetical protein
MSAIGTDRLCRPLRKHFRCWKLTAMPQRCRQGLCPPRAIPHRFKKRRDGQETIGEWRNRAASLPRSRR